MSVTFATFNTNDVPCAVLGPKQGMVRTLDGLSANWNSVGIAFHARRVGLTNLGTAAPQYETVVHSSSTFDHLYMGLKTPGTGMPVTSDEKFIGYGSRLTSSLSNPRAAAENIGCRSGPLFGPGGGTSNDAVISVGTSVEAPTYAGNNTIRAKISSTDEQPVSSFCIPVGIKISIQNRGQSSQKVIVSILMQQTSTTDTSESVLDTKLQSLSGDSLQNIEADSTMDFSGINSVFLYNPFVNSRLLIFGLKVRQFS
jgi:hypothetical protein